MSPTLKAWLRCLDERMYRKMSGFFEFLNGWNPKPVELAAWLRWLNMVQKHGARMDRDVRETFPGPRPGAA